jgi:large subunit ribosomal protein L30
MSLTETAAGKCLIAVRIRGMPRAHPEIKTTLKLLKLLKKHNAMIFYETPSIKGMLEKVKDLITWGEATEESIYLLLSKRGKTINGEKLTDEKVKEKFGFNSIKDLAKAIFNGEVSLKKLHELNLPFRLNSPSKGFKGSIKKPFKIGGELGYRGKEINNLIARMV